MPQTYSLSRAQPGVTTSFTKNSASARVYGQGTAASMSTIAWSWQSSVMVSTSASVGTDSTSRSVRSTTGSIAAASGASGQETDVVVGARERGLGELVRPIGVHGEQAVELGRVGEQLERALAHRAELGDHRIRYGALQIAVAAACELVLEGLDRGAAQHREHGEQVRHPGLRLAVEVHRAVVVGDGRLDLLHEPARLIQQPQDAVLGLPRLRHLRVRVLQVVDLRRLLEHR